MALTIDSTSTGNKTATTGTSLTFSHTVGASATLLVLLITIQSDSAVILDGLPTWNGTAMTAQTEYSGGAAFVGIHYIEAPETGTHNIVINTDSGVRIAASAISFNGTYTLGNSGTNTGAGTTATQTTATTGTTGFVLAVNNYADEGTYAYTGSGTSIQTGEVAGQYSFSQIYEAYAASANPTETWTLNLSRSWSTAYYEVYEASSSFRPITSMF